MGTLESVTNIDVLKAIIATVVMMIVGVTIFVKRRYFGDAKTTEEKVSAFEEK